MPNDTGLEPWSCGTACVAGIFSALVVANCLDTVQAKPLQLYRQAAYESPVEGNPGDLLLIAGDGLAGDDEVIYEAVDTAAAEPGRPDSVPAQPTASLGKAGVVSADDHALTVLLPETMRRNQPYALWVRNAAHEWSKPVFINDPRPLWLSPSFVDSSAQHADLPRRLKIIGRNLQPADGSRISVRLSGPSSFVLEAAPPSADTGALDRYVVSVELPKRLPPGSYSVGLTRDGAHWTEVPQQALEVRPDPPEPAAFPVDAAAYGGCSGNRAADAVSCLIKAIGAAAAAGGGTITFGPGIWHLSESSLPGPEGILVPAGVNFQGADRARTTLVLDADEKTTPRTTVFTLMGRNFVRDMTFKDSHVYMPSKWLAGAFFQLGSAHRYPASPTGSDAIDDVDFTRNIFAGPNVAIGGASPIRHLFITYNEFRAFRAGIELSADRYRLDLRFNVEDSIVAHNVFKPGSYLDTAIRQGTMASEIGASRRVDFSDNVADDAASEGLNAPADPAGWRAGFFWHANNDHEMLLVAANRATCTGDKDGDGEAVSYDNNANTFALPRAEAVLRASPASVTVAGPLVKEQFGRRIPTGGYYVGHWIQVGEGPGLGQVRKIVSYREDAADGSVTFVVQPDWDVVPAPARSRISVGREYWQVYTVGNVVDQRKPACRKSNRTAPKGGGISIWAQMADSVIDGNRQYDTDGIIFQMFYADAENGCPGCSMASSSLDFLDIRRNLVEGEYAEDDDCSSSGIFGSLAAAPRSPPPTVGFGLTIAHNTVDHADGRAAGAISMVSTWFEGPEPHRWALADDALIYRNTLLGLDTPPAKACKGGPLHPRTALSLAGSHMSRHSVLFANDCPNARKAHDLLPADTTAVCRRDAAPSCECTSTGAK